MSNRYRLLFVDDEERVLRSLRSIFRRQYDVYVATNGFDALDILANGPIDVIVCDQRMPSMNGNELLAFARERFPSVIRILLTDCVDAEIAVEAINRDEFYSYISKPWDIEKMKSTISDAARASRCITREHYGESLLGTENVIKRSVMDDAVVSSIKIVKSKSKILAQQEPATKEKLNSGIEKAAQEANKLYANKEKSSAVNPPQKKHGISLLLLEKDQRIRNSIRAISRQFGISVYSASSIIQAVRILSMRTDIGVVVLGMAVDNRETLASLRVIKKSRPDLSIIAVADVINSNTSMQLINEGQVFRCIQKPVEHKEFENALVSAIKRHHMLRKVNALGERYKVDETSLEDSAKSMQKLKELFSKSA